MMSPTLVPTLSTNPGDTPIYRQIYDRFLAAIAQGNLQPGDRIPSARALAKELGVARGTVELAYSLLHAEGYVQPQGQAGTVITPGLLATSVGKTPPVEHTALSTGPTAPALLPFQMGIPALDAFPRKIWARLGARQLRATQTVDLSYPPVNGLPALRTAIAAHLQVARGIHCSPAQVFITAGYRESVSLIIQTLLKTSDQVWTENPCYPPTRELLQHAGLTDIPLSADAQGMDIAKGLTLAPDAKAAIVTPAHQSPLSVTLSLPRRQSLLEWAEQQQSWIIEDDYDGEYRYISRPLPALKSLDRHGRVLYAGTFSKVLFPGIRLAYLVVPEALVSRFDAMSRILGNGSPALTQSIVSAFITEGHFARHIQRMRKLYGERRTATAAGLAKVLGKAMRIDPQPGGMHLIARLADRHSDTELAQRLRDNGLYAHALSRWFSGATHESGLLLGFTNIRSQDEAEELGQKIRTLL
ncbi:PLP-dependent aminotransferase family protein [Alcaligenaceae bacterium 429]|nr:PLP-dependent aminotransferase family protein [Alcaligenaceae bacterium 429]